MKVLNYSIFSVHYSRLNPDKCNNSYTNIQMDNASSLNVNEFEVIRKWHYPKTIVKFGKVFLWLNCINSIVFLILLK